MHDNGVQQKINAAIERNYQKTVRDHWREQAAGIRQSAQARLKAVRASKREERRVLQAAKLAQLDGRGVIDKVGRLIGFYRVDAGGAVHFVRAPR